MAKCAICGKAVTSGVVVDTECMDRVIILPVPIGGKLYVPYRYPELDGTFDEGVDELTLSGYISENGREFYTTYDDTGTNDISLSDAYLTYEEAEKALESMK